MVLLVLATLLATNIVLKARFILGLSTRHVNLCAVSFFVATNGGAFIVGDWVFVLIVLLVLAMFIFALMGMSFFAPKFRIHCDQREPLLYAGWAFVRSLVSVKPRPHLLFILAIFDDFWPKNIKK